MSVTGGSSITRLEPLIAKLLVALALTLLTACTQPTDPPDENYTFAVDVTGAVGTGVTVTVTDETAATVLTTVGPTTATPVSAVFSRAAVAGSVESVSVAVAATAVPSLQSVRVVVSHTDESYASPLTRTLADTVVPNDSSTAADVNYLQLFALPPD